MVPQPCLKTRLFACNSGKFLCHRVLQRLEYLELAQSDSLYFHTLIITKSKFLWASVEDFYVFTLTDETVTVNRVSQTSYNESECMLLGQSELVRLCVLLSTGRISRGRSLGVPVEVTGSFSGALCS